ncbi:glycosyltransferase family 2 protein [Frankia sp. AgB1.9]|uniref:glycosyltransferase family A protein n=1 Tax=unclassified Frankia TaxID=2632575 RepID=UPI001933C9B2|nr:MULTISPECIES: glycosyltransferase family A protein [unclassified Frankia]MBL7493092.1 glycosyltransferase family 2 protein [Frankia sp. AgW1.1]MBL7552001.1 glycosyltransferase family 2 protein [Frankia sp. AgB1.9]MBL7618039.1 glycosyltransferase family 2 protein [Frankia sp. AgB1.8]
MPAEPLPITVIVPIYNGAALLGEALTSALAQEPPPAQVIVVDDGSTDDPDAVLAQFPTVEVIKQQNQGVGAARNAGLRRADTDYVVFLDQDDRLVPGALAHAAKLLDTDPGAAFVSGRNRMIRADGATWESGAADLRPAVRRDHYRELLYQSWIVPPSTVLFRRSLLTTAGGWSEDRRLKGADDYELYLRLARQYPVLDTEECYAEYRMHGGNTSSDAQKMLDGITFVLRRERVHTQSSIELERARRSGLAFWRAVLGLKAAGQELMLAAKTRQDIPAAAGKAVVMVARHPVSFGELVKDHLVHASARAGGGGFRAVLVETRRRLG